MKKLTIFITILILGLSFSTIVSANMNNGHKVVPMMTSHLDEEDSKFHDLLRCGECGAVGCNHYRCPAQNFENDANTNFYDKCLTCGAI